jgi:23S rRNA (uridine2552-2'-O)-methyltransferase
MTKSKKGGTGSRNLTVKLKTARGRTVSSQRWLQRQLNDPFVEKAKALGYRSRAAFKIMELDDKFKFLGPKKIVVDLGAAPGGWTQVCVERIKPLTVPGGQVVGIDLTAIDPIPGEQALTEPDLSRNN